MMRKSTLLLIIVSLLVIINGYLLSHPNLLGRLGFIIYRYYFLKNFLRATITVSLLVAPALLIGWGLHALVIRQKLKKKIALMLLGLLVTLSVYLLIKTAIDFTAWTYAHSGIRLRLGAYLLPCLLAFIFVHRFWLISQYQEFDNTPAEPTPDITSESIRHDN